MDKIKIRQQAALINKKLKNITFDTLKEFIIDLGWEILYYPACIDKLKEILKPEQLKKLNNADCFSVLLDDEKYICINADLSPEECTKYLAHELGHIVLDHKSSQNGLIGMSLREQQESELFAKYLLKARSDKIAAICLAGVIVLFVLVAAGIFSGMDTSSTIPTMAVTSPQLDNSSNISSSSIASSNSSSYISSDSIVSSSSQSSIIYDENIPTDYVNHSGKNSSKSSEPKPNDNIDIPNNIISDDPTEDNPNDTISDTPVSSQSPSSSQSPEIKKININTATAKELSEAIPLEYLMCKSIVDYRKEHGDFTSLEDLMNINGIGKNVFTRILPFITL